MSDTVLSKASAQIAEAVEGVPVIKAFFDPDTFTVSYVVHDPQTMRAAIIDSVLDYDPASGRTAKASADAIAAYVAERGLSVEWLLETHAHADHLSAAPYLQSKLGGQIDPQCVRPETRLAVAPASVRHPERRARRNVGVP